MALPAVLAKLMETVATKVADVAVSKMEAVEKVAGKENVTLSDVQDLAEEFDSDSDTSEANRVRWAPQDKNPEAKPGTLDLGTFYVFGNPGGDTPGPDPADEDDGPAETPDTPDSPEAKARDPADPQATTDNRDAGAEGRLDSPGPETTTPAPPPPETGPDASDRLEAPPDAEEPLEAEKDYEPESISTARDVYEVTIRPHREEFNTSVETLSKGIEDELDVDPSVYGVLKATLKQTALDVASGSHDFLFGSIEAVAKVGEGTASGVEKGDIVGGVVDDLLGASEIIPVGKAAKAGVAGGKAMLGGARRVMGAVKKSEKVVTKADDAAKIALRSPGPKKALNTAPKKAPMAKTSAKPAPAKVKAKKKAKSKKKSSTKASDRIPKNLDAAQLKAAKRLIGKGFNSGFKKAWHAAVKRSPRAQEQLREAKQLMAQGKQKEARALARKAYNNVRGKFWQEVRKNPKLSKMVTNAGMEFPKKTAKGKLAKSAPYYKTPAGREPLTLEHRTRVYDDPSKAIDANNFLFSPKYENSVILEAIRKFDPFQ